MLAYCFIWNPILLKVLVILTFTFFSKDDFSSKWYEQQKPFVLPAFVSVCVCISFHRKGFSWLTQNNKCNAKDQTSNVVLRKLFCVKYLRRHVIDYHSRDLQASNCARVSIKPGRDTRSKRELLEPSKNQR